MTTSPILVPAASTAEVVALAGIWAPLARAESRPVLFVHVIRPAEPWHRSREQAAHLLQEAVDLASSLNVAAETQIISGYDVATALREVIADVKPALLLLHWDAATLADRRERLGRVLDPLLDNPPCDVLVMRGDLPPNGARRILIPTAGGPNVALAARVARSIARATEGRVTLLYVRTPPRPGREVMPAEEVFRVTMGDWAGDPIFETRVIEAKGVFQGILKEAQSGEYDLLFVGATEEGILRRVLVGDVPRRLAAQSPIPVGIAERKAPRTRTVARRVIRRVDALLPKLAEHERVELYRRLQESTRAHLDFNVRMALSALIAALGLLLNSPAVIIGAMLVAPLMSAVLAIGLGVALGDARMVRRAAYRTAQGGLLAVFISLGVAWLDPLAEITPEIAARARPTLLDLGVALASGVAGGYALSRKDVQEALPGVAIAVALVPPLSATGISLALGKWRVAAGAFLLYITNTVSIAGAGGLVFLLVGFRPYIWSRVRLRVFWRGVVGMTLLLLLVLVPLVWLTQENIAEARLRRALDDAVRSAVDDVVAGGILVGYTWDEEDNGAIRLDVQLQAQRSLSYREVTQLQDAIAAQLGRPVGLKIVVIPVFALDPKVPPTPTPTPTHTPTPTWPPSATPTPVFSPTPTATFTPSPTATPTNTPTPTPSPTSTPTATPTPTVTVTLTPVPVLAQVSNTGARGVFLRAWPGGPVVGALAEGALVWVVGEGVEADGLVWLPVRDVQGNEGWIAAAYLHMCEGTVC